MLIPLSISELRHAADDPLLLAADTGCTLDPGAVSEASRRAIGVKIEKMHYAAADQHSWYTYWLLILKDERIGVGLAGFKGSPGPAGEVELGYGISPNYQNRGLMTEAVAGLVKWASEHPNCRAVTAETLKSNPASQHVLRKNGFKVVRETEIALYWWIACNPTSYITTPHK